MESEQERIRGAGHDVVNDRIDGKIAISRAIGDWQFKQSQILPQEQAITAWPDVRCIERSPEIEYMILACDGIWDMMSSQEAIEFIKDQ